MSLLSLYLVLALVLCHLGVQANSARMKTLVVREVVVLRTDINAVKNNKTSGDRSLWRSSLFLPASPALAVGAMTGECVYVDGQRRVQQCTSNMVMDKDALMLGGPYCSLGPCFGKGPDNWGLLGGTGLYRTARGQMMTRNTGNDTWLHTIQIWD